MSRHRPGARVRLRRGRVAHIVANVGQAGDDGARFTLCGVPVLLDDMAALPDDPDCVGCYSRPSKTNRRIRSITRSR